jgi:hypothetical protein
MEEGTNRKYVCKEGNEGNGLGTKREVEALHYLFAHDELG